MLLSRFWYLLLTSVAVLAAAAALVAKGIVDQQWHTETENNLVRDRAEVEMLLRLEARQRLDAIAQVSADGVVRTALREASGRQANAAIPADVNTRLTARLRELNSQLGDAAGELFFALDQEGMLVAAISPTNVPLSGGLGMFPLVQRALDGYARDDVWIYEDNVYRVAARPVIDQGQYVGAIVHGKRMDDHLAELLSGRLDGASVGFFRGPQMFAGYMPASVQGAPRRDDLGAILAQRVLGDERLQAGDNTEPYNLSTGGLAIYSLVTGAARQGNVGYAIGRPTRSLGTPWAILNLASGNDWKSVPWLPLGGAAFLLFILSMLWIFVERDRPLGKMRKAAEALGKGDVNELRITDFGGSYRKIASAVNDAIARASAGGVAPSGKRVAANLDEILGPPAQAAPGPSFFGFADQPGGQNPEPFDIPSVPPPSAAKPTPPTMMMAGPPPGPPPAPPVLGPPIKAPAPPAPTPAAPAGPIAGPPIPAASPPAAAAPPLPGPRPPAPPIKGPPIGPPKPLVPPPAAEAPKPAAPVAGPAIPAAPTAGPASMASRPDAGTRKAMKRTLVGVAPPTAPAPMMEDEDEGATMVAKVPDGLAQTQTAGDNDEEKHFQEVFQSFLDTKKQCGESVAGLTYDKFLITLRKNRDQIVSRHGAKKVRFTVYVKDGKAALKATPIRD